MEDPAPPVDCLALAEGRYAAVFPPRPGSALRGDASGLMTSASVPASVPASASALAWVQPSVSRARALAEATGDWSTSAVHCSAARLVLEAAAAAADGVPGTESIAAM